MTVDTVVYLVSSNLLALRIKRNIADGVVDVLQPLKYNAATLLVTGWDQGRGPLAKMLSLIL